jgi:hypothetical protein
MFNIAYTIFKKKWETKEPEFAKYCENQLKGRSFWNRGVCMLAPLDNSGLENFQKHFKDF